MSRLLLESKSEQYVDLHFKAKEGRTWKIQNWNSGDIFGVFHSDTSSFVAYLDSPGNLYISAKGEFGGEVWTPGLRLAAYGDGAGISLYGEEEDAHTPQYGLMFAKTANFGGYGQVYGDWATYFTMDGELNRGWIFRTGSSNVASIGNNGIFDAKGYVGRCNGVTNSILSQNESYTHYDTNAPLGHWFNTDVRVQGRVYCGPNYGDMCMSVNNTILSGSIGGTISIDSSGRGVINTWITNLNDVITISAPEGTWCPVCYCPMSNEYAVRGITEFVIATQGGDYTPRSVKITVDLTWNGNGADIFMQGSSDYISGARVTRTNDYIFIEVKFNGPYSVCIYKVPSAIQVRNCTDNWSWYSGALYTSGNFGGSVITSCGHATGYSTSGYIHQRNGCLSLDSGNYSDYAMPTAHWAWSGQSGQPTWVWGGNNYQEYRVWNPANFNVNYANSSGYATSSNYSNSSGWTNASNTYESGNSITQDTTADTLFNAQGSGVSCAFMASGPTNNFADVLYWSGYQKWGGTQLAADYNAANKPTLAVRKYAQSGNGWGNWGYIHTSSFRENFGWSLPTSGMNHGDIYYVMT